MNREGISELEFIDIFGDNLRDLMREVGITQRELAREAGLSESVVSDYLNKRKMIGVRALINICIVLDCEITDILPYGGFERVTM